MILHLKGSSGCLVENRLWEEGQRDALTVVSPVIPAMTCSFHHAGSGCEEVVGL